MKLSRAFDEHRPWAGEVAPNSPSLCLLEWSWKPALGLGTWTSIDFTTPDTHPSPAWFPERCVLKMFEAGFLTRG